MTVSSRSALAAAVAASVVVAAPGPMAASAVAQVVAGASADAAVGAGSAGAAVGGLPAVDRVPLADLTMRLGGALGNASGPAPKLSPLSDGAAGSSPLSRSLSARSASVASVAGDAVPAVPGASWVAVGAASPRAAARTGARIPAVGIRPHRDPVPPPASRPGEDRSQALPSLNSISRSLASQRGNPAGDAAAGIAASRSAFDGDRSRDGAPSPIRLAAAETFSSAAAPDAIAAAGAAPGLRSGIAESASPAETPSPVARINVPAASGGVLSRVARYAAPALILGGGAVFLHASLLPATAVSAALLVSILLHETAHLWALRHYGDPTAAKAGRTSLNPLHSVDPLGTILVPAASLALSQALLGFPVLLGWAKPVPVDFNQLGDPKRDPAKVAMAGPAVNVALAALAGAAWWALSATGLGAAAPAALFVVKTFFKMNLALTLFNMLPLPWLDGGKLLISLLPARLYARWIYNPILPPRYQALYQHLYEGPANILTRFHVHSQEKVNGLTRLASLFALGAFYALSFTTLAFPLLFLALPCGGYDYWCIREKVRSEKAVQEMMDLAGEWGAAFAQIAEDLGVQSEVSAYEAEFSVVNAADRLLETLTEQEEFRNLTDDQKVEAFMKAFPDMWYKHIKEKVLPDDSEEKIRAVMSDPRMQPFYERLKAWLANPDNEAAKDKAQSVFERMRSPHGRKKLEDALKQAERERRKSQGS